MPSVTYVLTQSVTHVLNLYKKTEQKFLEDFVYQSLTNEPDYLKTLLTLEDTHLTQTTPEGMTPLHLVCAYRKNTILIEHLIDNGLNVNCPDNEGNTPLHHYLSPPKAEENPTPSILNFLLKKGGNLQAKNKLGETPWDCFLKYLDQLKTLNESSDTTFLHIACREKSDKKVIEKLMDRGADLRATDNFGKVPFELYFPPNDQNQIIDFKLFKKITLKFELTGYNSVWKTFLDSCTSFKTPNIFHQACLHSKNKSVIHLLLVLGSNSKDVDPEGNSPLHLYCLPSSSFQLPQPDLLRYLIEKLRNANLKNSNEQTIWNCLLKTFSNKTPFLLKETNHHSFFTVVCRYCNDPSILLELAQKKGVHSTLENLIINLTSNEREDSSNLLQTICQENAIEYLPLIEFLVLHSADIHWKDSSGNTLLHLHFANKKQILEEDLRLISLFDKYHFDFHQKNKLGNSLFDIFKSKSEDFIHDLQVQAQANKLNLIQYACKHLKNATLIKFLIETGEDLHCLDEAGNSLLHLYLTPNKKEDFSFFNFKLLEFFHSKELSFHSKNKAGITIWELLELFYKKLQEYDYGKLIKIFSANSNRIR